MQDHSMLTQIPILAVTVAQTLHLELVEEICMQDLELCLLGRLQSALQTSIFFGTNG